MMSSRIVVLLLATLLASAKAARKHTTKAEPLAEVEEAEATETPASLMEAVSKEGPFEDDFNPGPWSPNPLRNLTDHLIPGGADPWDWARKGHEPWNVPDDDDDEIPSWLPWGDDEDSDEDEEPSDQPWNPLHPFHPAMPDDDMRPRVPDDDDDDDDESDDEKGPFRLRWNPFARPDDDDESDDEKPPSHRPWNPWVDDDVIDDLPETSGSIFDDAVDGAVEKTLSQMRAHAVDEAVEKTLSQMRAHQASDEHPPKTLGSIWARIQRRRNEGEADKPQGEKGPRRFLAAAFNRPPRAFNRSPKPSQNSVESQAPDEHSNIWARLRRRREAKATEDQ